jgi:hypothetical protein
MRFAIILAMATVMLAPATAGCSRKLTHEECNHLLGRGVALAALQNIPEDVVKQSGIFGVPIDVELLRKDARGKAKDAIVEFDRACPLADDGGVAMCSRRAKNEAEFRACGGMATRAWNTGLVARAAVVRRFTVDECAKYAEHGVKISAITADDVSKLIKECEGWMEIGPHECRMQAKDAAAWKACDMP